MARIKKAQGGSLIKSGIKAIGKAFSKSTPKKASSRITDNEVRSAITQSQRDAMKARFRELDKEDEVIKKIRSGAIPVKTGPKGGGLFPMDKKRSGDKLSKAKGGKEMIKRADGSYSQRGLWDNIRAAKGSGKKPTAAMLKQEKKIKAKSKK